MANIPWHEEVLGFVHKLADRLEGYQIACEHEHSNCVLLAHQKVGRGGGGDGGDGGRMMEGRGRGKWRGGGEGEGG